MNRAGSKGFTLIEMVISMGFVSFLLIAIAMTIIQIGDTYNRGITLKDVNQVGLSVSKELQDSISQSTPFIADPGVGSSYKYISKDSTALTSYIKQDYGGRLCTGRYSYVWNYGKSLNDAAAAHSTSNLNTYEVPNASKEIKLVKVYDLGGNYCTNAAKAVVISDATELLESGEHDLALHDFSVISPESNGGIQTLDTKTRQALYNLSFVIGTNDSNALSPSIGSNTACRPPKDVLSDPSYCSVAQFNIVARAGNNKS